MVAELERMTTRAHVSIQPRRIHHFRIALSRNTVELPWASRAPLLERLRKHDAGPQVVIAFEAVGSTRLFAWSRQGSACCSRL
jgi:hypothetical protein